MTRAVDRFGRTALVLPGILLAALVAGCTGDGDEPGANGSNNPPGATPTGTRSVPPGTPLAYPRPLPDCAAIVAKLPTSVYTPQGGATPQAQQTSDRLRESVTCTVTGKLADSGSPLRIDVLVERPKADPVDGVPVERYRTSRPEQLVKERCPEFPYAPVPELTGGMTCYLRKSATEAQGLVAGSNEEATVLVTSTVADPGRTPAQLRTAAEKAARTIAAAILKSP